MELFHNTTSRKDLTSRSNIGLSDKNDLYAT